MNSIDFMQAFYFLTLVACAQAHFYVSYPEPRERTIVTMPTCENPTTTIPSKNVFKAGSYFVPRHGRTNHNGGFVMYSLTPLTASPKPATLLDKSNVFHTECQTLNCATKDMNDGGKYLADQDSYDNSCWGSGFYWPNKVGKFVLFYYSYGGFGSNGVSYQQLPAYSTCMNIELTASDTASSNSTSQCTFAGGDQTIIDRGSMKGQRTPAGQCSYKTFVSPPVDAGMPKVNSDIALGENYDELVKGVKFGVPSYVTDGTCKQISNVPKITDGPADSNNNKQPAAPTGGFAMTGGASTGDTTPQATTSAVASQATTSAVTPQETTSAGTTQDTTAGHTYGPEGSGAGKGGPRCRSV